MLNTPDEPTWSLKPGQMVEHCEVVEPLGRGGYGEVYKVIDPHGVVWALKWMRLLSMKDRNAVRRVLLEAMLLQKIDHINVVRYQGSGTTDEGNVFILMELLDGVSFRDLITNESLGVERVLRLGRQICDGLGQLHDIGAVHRDIKPENLFLLAADVVKIIDFGIAKCAGVHLRTTRGQTLGTALYMAPDQLSYKGEQGDPRWDIYAVGVVLYEMFLRRHPFETNGELPTAAVICGMQLQSDIPPLSQVIPDFPQDVSDVIAKALEKDPDKRYASAEAMGAALSVARKGWTKQHGEAAPTPLSTGEVQRVLRRLPPSSERAKPPGPTPRSAAAPIPARPRQLVTERIATPIPQSQNAVPKSLSRQIVTERMATLDASAPCGPIVTDRMPSDVAPRPPLSSWPAWLDAGSAAGGPVPSGFRSSSRRGPPTQRIDGAMPLAPPPPMVMGVVVSAPAAAAEVFGEESGLRTSSPSDPNDTSSGHELPPRATLVLGVNQAAAPMPGGRSLKLRITAVIGGSLLGIAFGYAILIALGRGARAFLPAAAPASSAAIEPSLMDGGEVTIDGGGAVAESPALREDPPAEPMAAGGSAPAASGSAAGSSAPPGSRPATPPRGKAPQSRGTAPRGTVQLPFPSETGPLRLLPPGPREDKALNTPEADDFIMRPKPSPNATAAPRKPRTLDF